MKQYLIISLILLSVVLAGCKEESITGEVVAIDVMEENCKDSDGGLDKSIKGTVTVGDEEYTDNCVAGLLIEYYCDNENAVNQNMRCANECSNGRCT